MKRCFRRRVACFLMAAMLCPLFLPCFAQAASEVLYNVTTSKNTNGNLYVHKFDNTFYQFITNVENDASNVSSVSIYIPSGDYSLSASDDTVKNAKVSQVGNLVCYTITQSGKHSVKVLAPEVNGKSERPYNYFTFTISGSNNTTSPSSSSAATQTAKPQSVSLTETSISSALFKESFSNNSTWSFSANVKNGGSTTGAVVFTFPENIKFSMTKDGSPIAYSSGASITKSGAYNIRVSATETKAGVSTEYYSNFKFTIVEAGQTTAPTTPTAPTITYVKTSITETANSNGTYKETLNSNNNWSFTSNVKNGGTATSEVSFTVPSSMKLEMVMASGNTNYVSGTKISANGNYNMRISARNGSTEYYATFSFAIKKPDPTTTAAPKTVQTKLVETQSGDGRYKQTFEANSGFSFISSVKNGASVTQNVMITMPGNLTFDVRKNGASVSGTTFSAAGAYTIKVTGKSGNTTYFANFSFTIKDVVNTSAPPTTAAPAVKESSLTETRNDNGSFSQVLNGNNAWKFWSSVSNGSVSNNPVKFTIPTTITFSVTRDGQPVSYSSGASLNTVGNYSIRVSGKSGATEYYAFFTFRIEQKNDPANYTIQQTTLTETANSNGTYTQKLNNNDNWMFLSTVANRGISNTSVKFTVPSSITFEVSRNGLPIAYASGETLREVGIYSVRVSAVNNSTEYYSLFNFEISDKQPVDKNTTTTQEKREVIKNVDYDLIIKDGQEFIINDSEVYIIEDGGSIAVESGGVLRVKNGGTVQVNKGGFVNINIGGAYYIEDGAKLQLNGGKLRIDSNQDVIQKITESAVISSGDQMTINAGKIYIIESGAVLTIQNAASLKIENGGALIVKNGGGIIIENGGLLSKQSNAIMTVENGGQIECLKTGDQDENYNNIAEVNRDVIIKKGEKYNIDTGHQLVINDGAKMTIESGAELNISSGAILTIENSGVLKIEKNAKLSVQSNGKIAAYGNGMLTVENYAKDLKIHDGAEIILGKDKSEDISNTTEIDENLTVNSGESIDIGANDIFTIKSGSEVNLKPGAALVLTPGTAFSIENGAALSDENLIVDQTGKLIGKTDGNSWYRSFSRALSNSGAGNQSAGRLIISFGGLVKITNGGKIALQGGSYLYNNGTINMENQSDIDGISNVVGIGSVLYGNGESYDISSTVALNLMQNVCTDSDSVSEEEMSKLLSNMRQKWEEPDTMTEKGYSIDYDADSDMFKITFQSGDSIYSSVCDGMIANREVRFSFDNPDEQVILYINDELVDYNPGDELSDHGFYRMLFPGRAVGEIIPEISFAIINNKVNNMHMLTAPDGYVFTGVSINGEYRTIFATSYLMSENRYDFVMQSLKRREISFQFSIERDVTPPKFQMFGIENGVSVMSEVNIVRDSSDIASVLLYDNNGKPVTDFNGETVKKTGKYLVYVRDFAGNVSFARFELKYKMNGAAVASVIAGVVLLIAAAGAGLYTRKHVRVR